MKKRKLFIRLLIPTLITLLLLPPLTCLVFFQSAKKYAYNEAIQNLDAFQQDVLPLIESCFSDRSNTDLDTNNSDTTSQSYDTSYSRTANLSVNEKKFLYQVSPLAARMSGSAQAIILGSEMNVIYPRDEQSRIEIIPLAKEFVKYIQSANVTIGSDTVQFMASDGENYLINIYRVPDDSVRIKYIIAYCPTYQISTWVYKASRMVFDISALFVLMIIVILWITTRSIIQPLHRLCRGAEEIGNGDFAKIESEFSIKELEELRLTMNRMSSQLMRSDEVQRNFFQNVSHELRNPLMSISGYAQGIEQGVFSSSQKAAHTILEESMRLTELVNSLLTLSRLESDQQNIILSSVRIADIIEDCIDRLYGLAIQKGVSLTLHPLERDIMVYGSEELISKVVDNLLTNAIHYAKTVVKISVRQKERQILILVLDDGDGISAKDMPHVFERCYKGADGNFGIGLAIAHSAAQKMNGNLTVVNHEDGGAEFILSLKRC